MESYKKTILKENIIKFINWNHINKLSKKFDLNKHIWIWFKKISIEIGLEKKWFRIW